ncbi:signal peptidase I [bacterium]|nr:signal peptidase I [bacterium]
MEQGKKEELQRSKGNKSVVWEYVEAIIIAIILAFIIRKFVIQAYKIPSGSMLETLQIGDHILVNKFVFSFKDPKRGDIIVFKYPGDKKRDFIKRLIGLPGETVEIRDKKVFVNDVQMDEPYVVYKDHSNVFNKDHFAYYYDSYARNRDNFGPITIPENKYLMLGDNRDFSQDSRYWGLLDRELIEGKALIIYWSWNGDETSLINKVRWNRIGMLLH